MATLAYVDKKDDTEKAANRTESLVRRGRDKNEAIVGF